MRFALLFCVCAVLLAGCNTRSKELEQQNAELQAKSNELYKELSTRDEYIGQVMETINGMHANLETAREKEKVIVSETDKMEGAKKASSGEIRQKMLGQLAEIDSTLKSDRKKLTDLQAKVRSNKVQIASLNTMIANLKATLEEREASIAALQGRVAELEGEVSQKTAMVAQRDSTIHVQESIITRQTSKINTGYYIIGTRRELKEKGVIADEGGLLWGLFGTTTILANGFDNSLFTPINKTTEMKIEVNGSVSEIVPKRNPSFYTTVPSADRERSTLQIMNADQFWQDNYLVIITN
jgi:hypothetical protein